jgi:hypothetical protein
VIVLTGGYFRTDTLKRTYELVVANAGKPFASRAGYKQWIRRLKRLPNQVGRLVQATALHGLAGESRTLYATDSLPIPLCKPPRHGRARLLDKDGAKFGVDASGTGFTDSRSTRPFISRPRWYPLPYSFRVGPAPDRSDQIAARTLVQSTSGGVLLVDEGYRGSYLFD